MIHPTTARLTQTNRYKHNKIEKRKKSFISKSEMRNLNNSMYVWMAHERIPLLRGGDSAATTLLV